MSKVKEISIGKIRWKLFLLGLFKIPMLGFVRPKLIQLDEQEVHVKIKLRRRSKNHLNSMYFGALAVGADVAAGIHAFYFAEQMEKKVALAFKGIKGEFLMRAESDITFVSKQGELIKSIMAQSFERQERINESINVFAYNTDGHIVAQFEMGLSVRVK